ncbi:protein of unknown function [Legionella hackeliae]|uniref:Uncharacterized protein n=1 Tax=Legionella hackeliae TaxID=449 RepID=A0A0A8UTX0_LEGHA|nr:protein of unknown function [Legionella hackeliae]
MSITSIFFIKNPIVTPIKSTASIEKIILFEYLTIALYNLTHKQLKVVKSSTKARLEYPCFSQF